MWSSLLMIAFFLPTQAAAPHQSAHDWIYRGDLSALEVRATMATARSGLATVEDKTGAVHTVHTGDRLGRIGAKVHSITSGRIELIAQTGDTGDRAWCRLALEHVRTTVTTSTGNDAVSQRRTVTQLNEEVCGPTRQDVLPVVVGIQSVILR